MKPKFLIIPLAAVLTITAHAQTYTLDTNGTTAGIQTGSANWATTATNWTLDDGVTRVAWPNTGAESANVAGNALAADMTLSLNSNDIQVDDFTGHFNGKFCFLQQLSNNSLIRTLTLTGGTYDGTGTTGSLFTINSGNLSITGAVGTTQFKLTGTSDIVKLGNGGLFLNSINHDFTGNLHVLAGNLFINSGNDTSLGNPENDIILDGGTLNHQSNSITLGATRTITLGANGGKIGGASGLTLTVQGPVTGTGSLEKVNAGTVELAATSDYAGTTTLSAGVLRLLANGTIPATSNLIINTTGNLNVRNTNGWIHTGTITGDGTGAINLNTGTNATLAGNISGILSINANNPDTDTTISGTISGGTNVTVQNNGTPVLRLTGTNAYTGNTTIQNGRLEAISIKDFGTASAIGAPANGDIQLGSGNNFATFRYTGAGDSTNRTFRLGDGTAANTGVGAIQNHGSGALTFTAPSFNTPIAAITAARTLWLGGTYTGAPNEIQGIIQDNDTGTGGIVNLGKANDATTWVLAGTNNYTGTTTIQGGTLKLASTGSIATSTALNVNAGGTFDATAHSTYTLTASQPVTFGINADGSGSSGKIAAATLDISNAVVAYNINGTPDDPVYILATYSSLSGNPEFASVAPPPAGYTLKYDHEGNKIALVQNPASGYATWSGGAPFDGDANADGVDNGLAWVLGAASPAANAIGLLPILNNTTDPDFMIFTFRRLQDAAEDSSTSIAPQISTSLGSWSDAVAGADVQINVDVDGGAPGVDLVEVKIRRTLAQDGRLFARLRTSHNPPAN